MKLGVRVGGPRVGGSKVASVGVVLGMSAVQDGTSEHEKSG